MTQIKMFINIKKSEYLSLLTSLIIHFIIFYPLFTADVTTDALDTTLKLYKKTYVNRVIQFGSKKTVDKRVNGIKNKKFNSASKLHETEDEIQNALDLPSRENYLSTVREIIESHIIFPIQAERLKKSGEVIIGLTINKNGTFTNLHFIKNASFEPFNKATKEALVNIGSFPSFPIELREESINVEQKFIFSNKY